MADHYQTAVSTRDTLCVETNPAPCGIVIFGASGDLAHRKLLPSLFGLYLRNLLPENFFVLGFARTPLGTQRFRQQTREALLNAHPDGAPRLEEFLRGCHYLAADYHDPALYRRLAVRLRKLARSRQTQDNVIFYLSTPPELYLEVTRNLFEAGLLLSDSDERTWRRVVIEKPFGHDLESARELDRALHDYLREQQIYRIDHYLGKETVQNILMLRFANAIFEPIWNRQFIDHVQITVAESIGIGHRAGYYEHTGLLRDMFQNHMLQLLALVGMEPPSSFDAEQVRNEKLKLLRCIRPFDGRAAADNIVRAQYQAGTVADETVCAYRQEEGVGPDAATETYVAARLMIDNWRWQGVPFYLRSGKRLKRRVSEIAIAFRQLPHSIFAPLRAEDLARNMLVLNVQPEEGMALTIQAKRPGPKLCMADLTMSFHYRDAFGASPPEAYERLLLDVMLGDQTLFIRRDSVEMAWEILMPALQAWQQSPASLAAYKAGSWGPVEADQLLAREGHQWRTP